MGEKLYHLTVNVVSEANAVNSSTQMYMLSATDNVGLWTSPLYSEDEYRRVLSGSGLTADQIESPIRTRTQTVFGGRGGGDLMFTEGTIKRMGLEPEKV